MILCLDIGNSHMYGGVYLDEKLIIQFRHPSHPLLTSDQLGLFFKAVFHEHGLHPEILKAITIASVVPSLDLSVRSAFITYFKTEPFFLTVDALCHLNIAYPFPNEIGADRIAGMLEASSLYPDEHIIVVDLGTATTFDALSKIDGYWCGPIIPGLYIAMKSLSDNTAKLSAVNLIKPKRVLGKSTAENIQSGMYYSHLGAMRELITNLEQELFNGEKARVIATGGFAYLFQEEAIFDEIIPELILNGLLKFAKAQIEHLALST